MRRAKETGGGISASRDPGWKLQSTGRQDDETTSQSDDGDDDDEGAERDEEKDEAGKRAKSGQRMRSPTPHTHTRPLFSHSACSLIPLPVCLCVCTSEASRELLDTTTSLHGNYRNKYLRRAE